MAGLAIHGIMIGSLKGNGIRVTDKQFPDVYRIAQDLTAETGLTDVPEIYLQQAGGMLNAFATRFLSRDFVVIYSDVLELAYEKGEDALAFVICHEFAHLRQQHILKHLLLFPALATPFLGKAYSRACEYTCDRYGAYYQPDGALAGLLVLAAGKKLYKRVDVEEYIFQSRNNHGFWVWFSELIQTHPHLYKRVDAVHQAVESFSIARTDTGTAATVRIESETDLQPTLD
jgi:Zn-dependent protease with chaperone function